jgi:hypothetical protein
VRAPDQASTSYRVLSAGVFVGLATYWACMVIVERPKLVPGQEGPLLHVAIESEMASGSDPG